MSTTLINIFLKAHDLRARSVRPSRTLRYVEPFSLPRHFACLTRNERTSLGAPDHDFGRFSSAIPALRSHRAVSRAIAPPAVRAARSAGSRHSHALAGKPGNELRRLERLHHADAMVLRPQSFSRAEDRPEDLAAQDRRSGRQAVGPELRPVAEAAIQAKAGDPPIC